MLPEAASQVARQSDAALFLFLVVAGLLIAGVTVTMIAFVIRFHRSRVTRTRQIHSNLALEIGWTVAPTLIVIVMFFIGYEGFVVIRETPNPKEAVTIEVTGQQWFWSFRYPEYDLTTTEMTIPVNKDVVLRLTSKESDVLHSFYVPAFRIKEDALPGQITHLWVNADKEGDYNVFCAEYCGKDHSRMRSMVHVVSASEFEAWVQRTLQKQYQPVDIQEAIHKDSKALAEVKGETLFQTYCVSCHGADGKGGGPYKARDFTDLDDWKKKWKRGPKLSDIFVTITTGVPETNMRSFGHLPVKERLALMHYVAHFGDPAKRPETTEEDLKKLKKEFLELDPSAPQRQIRARPEIPIEDAMRQLVEGGER